jgi:Prokaryotic homologs of the JAB domain
MVTVSTTSEMHQAALAHLRKRPEQVGFFLAHYSPEHRDFELVEWRAQETNTLAHQSDFHLEVSDQALASAIKWAWDSGLSLVEVHSHGSNGPTGFSGSDVRGFLEWVPHVWWRLGGRPYAALVVTGDTFDGIAWIEGPQQPQQITGIDIVGNGQHQATRDSLAFYQRWLDEEPLDV